MAFTRQQLENLVEANWAKQDIRALFGNNKENLYNFWLTPLEKRKVFPVQRFTFGAPPYGATTFHLGDKEVPGLNPGEKFSKKAVITYTGSRTDDFDLADKLAGINRANHPTYVWHHYHDYDHKDKKGTMFFMAIDDHKAHFHWGGCSQYRYAHDAGYA